MSCLWFTGAILSNSIAETNSSSSVSVRTQKYSVLLTTEHDTHHDPLFYLYRQSCALLRFVFIQRSFSCDIIPAIIAATATPNSPSLSRFQQCLFSAARMFLSLRCIMKRKTGTGNRSHSEFRNGVNLWRRFRVWWIDQSSITAVSLSQINYCCISLIVISGEITQ